MGTQYLLELNGKYSKATTWRKKERLVQRGWNLITTVCGWNIMLDIPEKYDAKR